jgi:hypothetical protein
VLYSRQYGASNVYFDTSLPLKNPQIKYLRVPDTLLDTVKEEQSRAREAGRSGRGAGTGSRGASQLIASIEGSVY